VRVCGIDPGRRGGIVLLDGTRVVTARPMPLIWLSGATEIVDPELSDWLRARSIDLVAIEQQAARGAGPGRNSPTSAHTAGRLYGSLLAAVALSGVPMRLVSPVSWQRRAGLFGAPKRRVLQVAPRRVSDLASWLRPVRGERSLEHCVAIAEAALIAAHVVDGSAEERRSSAVEVEVSGDLA
jgi:hypothetical protein